MKKSRILLAAALPLTAAIVYFSVSMSDNQTQSELSLLKPEIGLLQYYGPDNPMTEEQAEAIIAEKQAAKTDEELDSFYRKYFGLTLEDINAMRESRPVMGDEQKAMLDELDIAKEKAADGDFSALDEFEKKYDLVGVFGRDS